MVDEEQVLSLYTIGHAHYTLSDLLPNTLKV